MNQSILGWVCSTSKSDLSITTSVTKFISEVIAILVTLKAGVKHEPGYTEVGLLNI